MKKDLQRPIPVSPRVLWDQVRFRLFPLVMFLCLVATSIYLWDQVSGTPSLQGVAEGSRAILTSPHPGLIAELKVRPYQLVNQGDPIAVIRAVDPQISLDLLQTELRIIELRHQPTTAQQNAMDFQRVRVELLRLRTELAVSRIQLKRAENDAARNLALYREKLLSEDLYDLSIQTRDALQTEVAEKNKSVEDLEKALENLRVLGDPAAAGADQDYEALLQKMESAHAQAGTNWGTVVLRAPIAGMVTPALRNVGEYVLDGEPILGVNSLWSERVVAYLRQPYPVDPQVGMEVRVTTRNQKRLQFALPIAQIGAQVEPITNILAYVRQGALVDVGLPIVVNLPAGTSIRPGEIVDLRLNPARIQAPSEEMN